jgi:hypothetical protein
VNERCFSSCLLGLVIMVANCGDVDTGVPSFASLAMTQEKRAENHAIASSHKNNAGCFSLRDFSSFIVKEPVPNPIVRKTNGFSIN